MDFTVSRRGWEAARGIWSSDSTAQDGESGHWDGIQKARSIATKAEVIEEVQGDRVAGVALWLVRQEP